MHDQPRNITVNLSLRSGWGRCLPAGGWNRCFLGWPPTYNDPQTPLLGGEEANKVLPPSSVDEKRTGVARKLGQIGAPLQTDYQSSSHWGQGTE
ncbi:hypothetical protein SUGI_1063850 [Cryptomeria japonica]|nr:hypothetical protein SUGI_1063850 [Cryptomeria japonica]